MCDILAWFSAVRTVLFQKMLCIPSCCEMDSREADAPVPGDGGGGAGSTAGVICQLIKGRVPNGSTVKNRSCGKLWHGGEPVDSSVLVSES